MKEKINEKVDEKDQEKQDLERKTKESSESINEPIQVIPLQEISNPLVEIRVLAALEEIRPAIQMDGGDIQYMGLEGAYVKIRLLGACGTCPASMFTLKMGVENLLRDRVPEIEGIMEA